VQVVVGPLVDVRVAAGAPDLLTSGFDVEALDDGDFRRTHPFGRRDDLAAIRADLGEPLTENAVRFVLDHPAVTGAIVGVRNEQEARQIVRSAA